MLMETQKESICKKKHEEQYKWWYEESKKIAKHMRKTIPDYARSTYKWDDPKLDDSRYVRVVLKKINFVYEVTGDTSTVLPLLIEQLQKNRTNGNKAQELKDLYSLVIYHERTTLDSAIFYCKQAISLTDNYFDRKEQQHLLFCQLE